MTTNRTNSISAFQALHEGDGLLVLPNAWDVCSARIFAATGFDAIGTTSAGIAASHGYADGEEIPPQLMLARIREIAESVPIPVTADLESGYSDDPIEIANYVVQASQAGAVGINLEDKRPDASELVTLARQTKMIRLIRSVTDDQGLSVFINARTDCLWPPSPEVSRGAVDEAIRRCVAFTHAGADGVFVPGVARGEDIERLLRRIDVPLNVLALPTVPSIGELKDMGVRRLSLGSGPVRAAMSFVATLARDLKDSNSLERIFAGEMTFDELNTLGQTEER